MKRAIRRRLHRLRFTLWLLGAADFDGFKWRAHIVGRIHRGLLGARRTERLTR
jgi:hypothetical protein